MKKVSDLTFDAAVPITLYDPSGVPTECELIVDASADYCEHTDFEAIGDGYEPRLSGGLENVHVSATVGGQRLGALLKAGWRFEADYDGAYMRTLDDVREWAMEKMEEDA